MRTTPFGFRADSVRNRCASIDVRQMHATQRQSTPRQTPLVALATHLRTVPATPEDACEGVERACSVAAAREHDIAVGQALTDGDQHALNQWTGMCGCGAGPFSVAWHREHVRKYRGGDS